VSLAIEGAAPPPTPGHQPSGWCRVALSIGPGFIARQAKDKVWEVLPEAPRLDRGASGQPLASLALVLARTAVGVTNIEPLVVSGSLALTCSLGISNEEMRALSAILSGRCRPYYVRSATSELRGSGSVYARAAPLGIAPRWGLNVSLPSARAIEVLHAFNRQAADPSPLRVTTELHGVGAPVAQDVLLAEMLGGLLEGMDPDRYLTIVAVGRDGRLATVPPLRASAAGAKRGPPGAGQMLAVGSGLQALPGAMTSGATLKVSAAALASGGASSVAVQINPNTQVLVAHDAIWHGPVLDGDESEDLPTMHYPTATNPAAPFWPDALDASVGFYAPGFEIVVPAPTDNPAQSPFSFVYSRSGPVVGGSGGAQMGLTATVRLTVRSIVPAPVAAALAGTAGVRGQAVPLENISCGLEISYRRAGTTDVLTQRFPCAVSQAGDRLVATAELLDDWVRLTYAGLATPATGAIPAPRLVVDYSFPSYAWIFTGPIVVDRLDHPEFVAVGVGINDEIVKVEKISQLPQRIERPVLVEESLAVVGPSVVSQFRREVLGVKPRDLSLFRQQATTVGPVRPPLGSIVGRRRRLVSRTLVRSEGVPISLPCEALGSFYREQAPDGTSVAVGCQDSLKLGETATKAFQEIPELRNPTCRVWKSLAQPGRFLITPTTYRIGRYGAAAGDRAFQPMVALYGLLDPEPTNNRYVLAATLIPDVPPPVLATLSERLADHVPARAARSIVFPTDPFIGAKSSFSWAIPGNVDPPQTITVVDAVTATFSMLLKEALLFMAMVNRTGIQGAVTFALPDGTEFQSALSIDGDVIGPAESGPVGVTVVGAVATLRNQTGEAMNVTDITAVALDGTTKAVAVGMALDPAAETTVAVDPGTERAYADASPIASRASHSSINSISQTTG
jgi:hypothetical protein